jgi:hypothetical protein
MIGRSHSLLTKRSLSVVVSLTVALWGPAQPSGAQVPLTDWTIAGPYPANQVAREGYPNFYAIFLAPWVPADAGADGWIDLTAHLVSQDEGGDLALARSTFFSPDSGVVDLHVEYSKDVDVFFNGWRIFSGRRAHDIGPVPMESAVTGDRVPLYVQKGLNDVLLMVASDGDGWGYRAWTSEELSSVPRNHDLTDELWITPDTFLTPESVLKDPNREVLYVSSFDNQFSARPEPSGYISRLGMDGEILEQRWVDGLHAPTGMDVWRDTLYVAERESLLAIDLASGEVAGRWPIPDVVFPNDLVIDDDGVIYISDTRTGDWADSRIYRFREGEFDIFANEGVSRANGLWVHDGWLVVGSSGDGFLKRIELETGRIENIISFGSGIIDGIRTDEAGNYLVSRWEGQIFRISPAGEVVEVLDALPQGWNTADFEYLPDERVLLIPTFLDNRVRAVRIRN